MKNVEISDAYSSSEIEVDASTIGMQTRAKGPHRRKGHLDQLGRMPFASVCLAVYRPTDTLTDALKSRDSSEWQ